MLFLCMLHVTSTVWCFILEVTNYEPLVYFILLVCYAQTALKMYLFIKADATESLFMTIMYTYLVPLTLFLCIYFTCICIHMHSLRCQVLYTIEFNIIILTAQYMIYISYDYHPEILVLKIGWSLILRENTRFNSLLLTNFSLWSNTLTNVIYYKLHFKWYCAYIWSILCQF